MGDQPPPNPMGSTEEPQGQRSSLLLLLFSLGFSFKTGTQLTPYISVKEDTVKYHIESIIRQNLVIDKTNKFGIG